MKYVITVEPAKLDGDEIWKGTVEGFPDIVVYEDTPEEVCEFLIDAVETLNKIKQTKPEPTQLDLFK